MMSVTWLSSPDRPNLFLFFALTVIIILIIIKLRNALIPYGGIHMLDSLFLSFREGLEAALIIGIILATLSQLNRKHLAKVVGFGTIAGVIGSLILGWGLFTFAQSISHEAEEIMEAVMRIVAAGLIAYFILWLHRNQQVAGKIKGQTEKSSSSKIGLFLLAFLSVIREGMELMVFNMTKISESAGTVALGSIIGIVAAALVAYVIFKTTIKLNLSLIFKALGLILVFLGGEMFAEGIVELLETHSEAMEILFLAVFIVPALFILLKDDMARFRRAA